MTQSGKDGGTICGTVVPNTFRTTVPWNDLRGTVERFCFKSLNQRIFEAISEGTVEPFERGALAPLSGRSVPGPSLRGTSGTASSSSLAFLWPTSRRSPTRLRRHCPSARKVSAMYKPGEDLRVIVGDVERSVEVKCRAAGFRQLYDWLNQRDVLIAKPDRQKPLVVLLISLATETAQGTA
jgi:hypothetical protein